MVGLVQLPSTLHLAAASVQAARDSSGSGQLLARCLSLWLRGFPRRGGCCWLWWCRAGGSCVPKPPHAAGGSSSPSPRQGHGRAGWCPARAARMGCSSPPTQHLGDWPATAKANCWHVVTASCCHEHLIFNSSQGFFSTVLPRTHKGWLPAPVLELAVFGCAPD